MPDILGVTNSVPGQESSNINRNLPQTPNDPVIKNAPDPTRINRTDNRTERQDSGDAAGPGGALRYDSNFQTFLQKLTEAPDLLQAFSLIVTKFQSIVSSGIGEGISGEIGALMEMLKMDQGELLSFLQNQLSDGARFSGSLFTLLREAYSQSQTSGIKNDILQFAKKFGDYTSSAHIEGNLMRTLTRLTRAIPATYGNQLLTMAEKLEEAFTSGDRGQAMSLLQETILPFLSVYTEKTHDMGFARNLISLLALDIARYENASEEGVLEAFHQLNGHEALRSRLGNMSDEALLHYIKNNGYNRTAGENKFAEKLVNAVDIALQGRSGTETQEAFKQILSSLLVNESVYMPINHAIIPMDWNGKLMFSELWVDPDAEDNLRRGGSEKNNTIRFLFKMDIQGLGFFDMMLTYKQDTVQLQINCPQKIAPFSSVIQSELSRIVEDNGMKAANVQVQPMQRPVTLSEVFPKIFEGDKSVNVKI